MEKELKRQSLLPKQLKKREKWQVLFVSDKGKIRVARKFEKLLAALIVALVISIGASILFSILYLRSAYQTTTIGRSLAQAKELNDKLQREKEYIQAQLLLPEMGSDKETSSAGRKSDGESKNKKNKKSKDRKKRESGSNDDPESPSNDVALVMPGEDFFK